MKYTRFRQRERVRLHEERAAAAPVHGQTGARFGGAAGRRQSRRESVRLEQEVVAWLEDRKRVEPARSARLLLATAVRFIPRLERARYLEEFRAELLDVSRSRRLWHALSVLRGAFVLRLRRGPTKKAADAVKGG